MKIDPILEIAFLMTLPNDECSEHIIDYDEFIEFMIRHEINTEDLINYCIEKGYYNDTNFK